MQTQTRSFKPLFLLLALLLMLFNVQLPLNITGTVNLMSQTFAKKFLTLVSVFAKLITAFSEASS